MHVNWDFIRLLYCFCSQDIVIFAKEKALIRHETCQEGKMLKFVIIKTWKCLDPVFFKLYLNNKNPNLSISPSLPPRLYFSLKFIISYDAGIKKHYGSSFASSKRFKGLSPFGTISNFRFLIILNSSFSKIMFPYYLSCRVWRFSSQIELWLQKQGLEPCYYENCTFCGLCLHFHRYLIQSTWLLY